MKTKASLRVAPASSIIVRAMILSILTLCTSALIASAKSASSPLAEQNQSVTVSGVKVTVPNGFRLQQSSIRQFAFMRHEKENLALFVAVPEDQKVSDTYLTDLSNRVVSQLLKDQKGFEWKILHQSKPQLSAYQNAKGTIKGLNDHGYVQTDYVVVKAQGRVIVLGSLSVFGSPQEARHLFDVEGYEFSVSGWEGLFKLIASATGETN